MTKIAGFLILEVIEAQAPKNATGVYITSSNITFGKRTNKNKFPDNFIPFNLTKEDILLRPGLAATILEIINEQYDFQLAT